MTEPTRWIERVQPVIVIRPDMTPDEWQQVFAAMGITQERIDALARTLVTAAEQQQEGSAA